MWRLKDDLGDDLDVAGFARADRGSAVEVANGVGDLAEAAGSRADPCCRGCWGYWGSRRANAADGANSGCKVDAIQEVEEVCSKLDFDPLGDWDVLDKRQVHIPKTRPGKFVSREVCRAWAGCRQRRVRIREAERSGVPPLRAKAGVEFVTDTGIGVTDQRQSRECLVGRLSAVPVHYRADLPVVERALGPARGGPGRLGHIIGTTDGEKVSSVEITVSVIRLKVESIIQNLTAVLADFIKSVRPGVSELGA